MDIAMGMMNALLPRLGELVMGEYKLQKGVKGEVMELEKEMQFIYAALCMVSELPADQLDPVDKVWVSDVRELSYDVEDSIDTIIMRGKGYEPSKPLSIRGLIHRATNLFKKAKDNHNLHHVIKDLLDKAKKISERRDRYKLKVAPSSSKVDVDPRLEAMYRKATDLVGIDGPKNELAKRLMDEGSSSREQPQIISIVGFGGLGKTTLATALLDNLKEKFDCHVFVSVSLKPDIMMVLKLILRQLGHNISVAYQDNDVIDNIRGLLKHKRCLCVIDDVWDKSAWDTINLALSAAKTGSKIIMTTRKEDIAEHAGGNIYKLKPLSDDDSRKLFSKRIFDSEDDCPDDLREVTKRILKKCGGVPLAIITIASLLANRPKQVQEWEKTNKSIGTGLQGNHHVDNMRKILSLSYNDLPFYLKPCFLYLSKYPEDKKIRKDVLIWSWIAQGFVTEQTHSEGTSLEDIGESYFIELVNRSLIQLVDIHSICDQDGLVHACQMHDMVLDLINHLAAEEGFLTTILSDGQQAGSSRLLKKIRRLALHCSRNTYVSSEASEQLSQVKSLTVFGHVNAMPPLPSFAVLRVLQLEDCRHLKNDHLVDISMLRLLRFLRLRRLNISKLPETIGNLEFLETLDIRGSKSTVWLPMSFINLGRLVRLLGDELKLPERITLGNMKSLQELVTIWADQSAIREIGNLSELRAIAFIVDKTMMGDLKEFIIQYVLTTTNLKELDIRINGYCFIDFIQQVPSRLERFASDGVFKAEFPRWINSSLSCLTVLSINLHEDLHILPQHLQMLGELPSLCFLRINVLDVGNLQKKLTIQSGVCAFRCLRELHFYSRFMFITFQARSMPMLQRLYLNFHTEKTDSFDFGLENLPSLRHVFVDFVYGARRSKEATAAIREALKNNPNHPSLDVVFTFRYVDED